MQEDSRDLQSDARQEICASDFHTTALPALPDLPGMISPSEGRYLFWVTSNLEGAGCAVEVGSWLGRSSVHIAAGLAASGRPTPLHCFDGFTWAPNDVSKSTLPLRPGDDFQHYFLQNTAAFGDRITAHKTKIAQIQWSGEPVELLFLDAPKRQAEIARCLEVFGPALIPGTSVIAIQDYLYFPAYALAVCMHILSRQMELIHVVLDGSTVAFRVTAEIDLARSRPPDWNFRNWTVEQVEAAWDRILGPLPISAQERLAPGRALHLYDCGAKAAALRAMQALPMTTFQQEKIAGLAKSHHYLSYPELFTAAGFPGSTKQNLMARAKRLRDWARKLSAVN
ncbi:MAG: class I SAM-dependent methyltransferase [Kiloniellaceae bacterium]